MRLPLFAVVLVALAGPAFAADKLVPAGATGALADHRGKPWIEPLTNCAGFHSWNGRNLRQAGNTQGAWDEAGKAADFMTAAAKRIAEDRGLSSDAAMEETKVRMKNVVTYLDLEDTPPDVPGWTSVCQEYLAGYKKAVG